MPFEDVRLRFTDILDAIRSIEQFVTGMDGEAYARDERTQAAVERKLLIISEAAMRMKDAGETLCPEVPWRDIRGIGNWLRHGYDRIDPETIWNTVQDDLPPLKTAVKRALAQNHPR
ncbi:MAG TPA: HepT-like ribonuclease domain-containing protein [Terracidiphilus sp.]